MWELTQEKVLSLSLSQVKLVFVFECSNHCFYVNTDPPSTPLIMNRRASVTAYQPTNSTVTVEWDPPSSPGGVSVSYVLIISPPPLSQSPLTVETTSAQITVSYNTQYNLTIRADNCAGSSNDTTLVMPPIGWWTVV